MAENLLGKLVGVDKEKDAMHVAVMPALVSSRMEPGVHVSIKDGWAYLTGETVGIIDPFLSGPLKKGNRVWVLMYPNSVTNLRHEWDHPLLAKQAPEPSEPEEDNGDNDECRHC